MDDCTPSPQPLFQCAGRATLRWVLQGQTLQVNANWRESGRSNFLNLKFLNFRGTRKSRKFAAVFPHPDRHLLGGGEGKRRERMRGLP